MLWVTVRAGEGRAAHGPGGHGAAVVQGEHGGGGGRSGGTGSGRRERVSRQPPVCGLTLRDSSSRQGTGTGRGAGGRGGGLRKPLRAVRGAWTQGMYCL